jgi:hypothetical protein
MKTLLNISKINIKLTLILSVLAMLLTISNNTKSCPILEDNTIYGSIKGRVLDSEGMPAIGGTVRVLGTTRGAHIKANGEFNIIKIIPGTYEIVVTYTGKKDFKVSATISENEITNLNDIVLTAERFILPKELICGGGSNEMEIGDIAEFENLNSKLLKIYPNPVVNSSVVEFVSQENMITKVIVTNLNTMISKDIFTLDPNFKESKLEKFNINSFDFSEFADGEYLISLVYQSESESEVKSSLKFIINKNN